MYIETHIFNSKKGDKNIDKQYDNSAERNKTNKYTDNDIDHLKIRFCFYFHP